MTVHFVLTKDGWASIHPVGMGMWDLQRQKPARLPESEMANRPCIQRAGHCLVIGSEDSPLVLKQNRRLGRHRASSLSMLPCKFGTGLAVSRGGHVTPHCGKKCGPKGVILSWGTFGVYGISFLDSLLPTSLYVKSGGCQATSQVPYYFKDNHTSSDEK